MESARPPYLCTLDWWEGVIRAWNTGPHAVQLAGFGAATFSVLESELPPVRIEWDAAGLARVLEPGSRGTPCFSATLPTWQSFVEGRFTAAQGVMHRRIRIEGSTLAVLPFAGGFTLLAAVAKVAFDDPGEGPEPHASGLEASG